MITICSFCYVYNTNYLCLNTVEVLRNEVKKTEVTKFYPHALWIKYLQGDEYTLCFSSLDFDLLTSVEYVT